MLRFRFSVAGIALATICLSSCAGSPTPAKSATRHVFVIVMENKSPQEALSGTFTASLSSSYGEAASYRAVAHPSVPNYLALTSGSKKAMTDLVAS